MPSQHKKDAIKKNASRLFKSTKDRPSFIGFDEDARTEFITGFHKRKLQRKKEGRKRLEEKIKKEKQKEKALIRNELNQKIQDVKKEQEKLKEMDQLSNEEFLVSIGGFDDDDASTSGAHLSQRQQKKHFLEKQKEIRYAKPELEVVVKTEMLDQQDANSDSEDEDDDDKIKSEDKDNSSESQNDEQEDEDDSWGHGLQLKRTKVESASSGFPQIIDETSAQVVQQSKDQKETEKKLKDKKKRKELQQPLDFSSQKERRLHWEKVARTFGLNRDKSHKHNKALAKSGGKKKDSAGKKKQGKKR